jgi:hypothetical protein
MANVGLVSIQEQYNAIFRFHCEFFIVSCIKVWDICRSEVEFSYLH